MSNKYLEKIAQLSNENKQVANTFLSSWGASVPADMLGGYIGSRMGSKYKGLRLPNIRIPRLGTLPGHISGEVLGATAGTLTASGIAELAAIKHSLHGKVKE